MRINRMMADQLGIDQEEVLYNIAKFGNTTVATIPLLFTEFTEKGTIRREIWRKLPEKYWTRRKNRRFRELIPGKILTIRAGRIVGS